MLQPTMMPMEILQPIEAIQPLDLFKAIGLSEPEALGQPQKSKENAAPASKQNHGQPASPAGSVASARGSGKGKGNLGNLGKGKPGLGVGHQRATSVSIPKDEPTEAGCYLTFESTSEGTMFLNWSETHVEGALAYLRPGKPVPKFKFVSNGGKSELIRSLRSGSGQGMKRYFEGWVQFLKLAREQEAQLVVWNDKDVALYFLDNENTVNLIEPSRFLQMHRVAAIAAIGHDNETFQGVATVTRDYFSGTGNRIGAAMLF